MNIPNGFKLVPEVATLEMKNAGWRECDRQGVEPESIEMQTIWTAMHLEAPIPPQPIFDEADELNRLFGAAREMLRIAGIANQGSNAYNRAIVNLHEAVTACSQSRATSGEAGHE